MIVKQTESGEYMIILQDGQPVSKSEAGGIYHRESNGGIA